MGTNFVPLVGLNTRDFGSTNEGAVRHPVGFEDTTAGWRRAAVTALLSVGVVQVPVSIFDILAARLSSQVVSQATISVIDTVGTIDAVHQISGVAYVVIVSSGGGTEFFNGVLNGLSEGLLEDGLPDGSFGGRRSKGGESHI